MKLGNKLTSAAVAVALLAGGGVATATAAQASEGSADSAYMTVDAKERVYATGAVKYREICERAVASAKDHARKSGGKNIVGSCANGVTPRDRHLWYGLVTWDAY